jgi:thiamine biosynthesis lipoprotein
MIRDSLTLVILSIFLGSCNQDKLMLVRFAGEAQGTYYAVTYYEPSGIIYQQQVDSILRAFDESVSLYKPQSVISRINRNDSAVQPDPVFTEIFHRSMEVSKATGGSFDVTVGPLVRAWGFSFSDRMKLDSSRVDSLVQIVGYHRVRIFNGKVVKEDPGMQLDFNAIAQGYSVDLLASFLEAKGITNYLIDIGGEVLAMGHKPDGGKWTVGIERPTTDSLDARELKAIVALENSALATSGNYRKFFEENGIRYSHTIDPFTGYPVHHSLLSVSVKAVDCCTADAYATAFMVMGLERSKEFLDGHNELDAYFIFSDEKGSYGTFMTEGIRKILIEEKPF